MGDVKDEAYVWYFQHIWQHFRVDKRFGANDMFRTWFDGNKVLDGICRFYVVLDERIHFEKFCSHSETCSIVLPFLGIMICGIDIFSVSFATFLPQVR